MKIANFNTDFENISLSKTSTPKPGNRKKNNLILQPILLSITKAKKKNCEDEVITLDETTEDEKKVNCADNSIEFIRYRKASKRKRVIDTLIKKKSELRKRRSFTKFPKDVKQLTKVNRRLSRGLNEPRQKDLKINNVGYQFNPMQKPVFNFAVNGPVNFSAKKKRPIVIDGSNVAIEHGIQTKGKDWFSVKGLEIAINYFKDKGHKDIKVVVPRYRLSQNDDRELMKRLEDQKYLVLTPSRIIRGRRVTSYDDRFIIDIAVNFGGVIVSNDQYRDLLNESGRTDEAINFRLLPYNFVDDFFMLPKDPLGRGGPTLEDFLHF